MKKITLIAFACSLFFLQSTFAEETPPAAEPVAKPQAAEAIFQVSTLDTLMGGDYDGRMTVEAVRNYGDFGLGTFDHLDGEMILLQGEVFQIKGDGKSYPVENSSLASFAEVTHFEADKSEELKKNLDLEGLKAALDQALEDKHSLYAIKISGKFKSIQVRSVPRQEKPYPTLEEVTKNQAVFDLKNVKGTLVGFRFPENLKGIGVPGYHFHFLSEDKSQGGHVLKLQTKKVKMEADKTAQLLLDMGQIAAGN